MLLSETLFSEAVSMVRLPFLLGGFSEGLFGHQTRAPDECLEDGALDQLELLDRLLFELLLPLDEEPEEDELLDLEQDLLLEPDLEESLLEADGEETRENLLTKGRPRAVVAGPEIQEDRG